jgi:hypothetical protein
MPSSGNAVTRAELYDAVPKVAQTVSVAQKPTTARATKSALNGAAKVGALQSASQTAGSLSGELRPGLQQAAVPARPPVIAARKKPSAPKTNGPISLEALRCRQRRGLIDRSAKSRFLSCHTGPRDISAIPS